MKKIYREFLIDFEKQIPQSIMTMRRQAGLTQSELAKNMGVNQASICKWESGQGGVSVLRFLAVCLSCNTDPRKFMSKLDNTDLKGVENDK